jgi:recombination protein RecA
VGKVIKNPEATQELTTVDDQTVQAPAEFESLAKLPELPKEQRAAAIKTAIALLEKNWSVKVQKLGGKLGQRVASLPSGLPTLDETALTCGGIPDGRIVEIFGPESSGKTTLSLQIVAAAQAAGDMAAFVDAEHALDPHYAKKLGVDVDNLYIAQPDYGEQALEVVIGLIKSQAFRVIVVDSVSALVPKAELDGDMGDAHMGLQARMMGQAMRKMAALASTHGVTVIFINQIREKVGISFGNPEVTSGGKALKFYASIRLDVRRVSKTDGGEIKEGDIHIGHKLRIKVVKNKVGPPFRMTEVSLYYATGFDTRDNWVDYALELGVCSKGKTWYEFDGESFYRKDLTTEPIFSKLVLAAKKKRDEFWNETANQTYSGVSSKEA